jgi:UPF0755 protein
MLIFGGAYYTWITVTDIFQPVTTVGVSKTIPIEITQGETTAQIADDLVAKGLIRNALAFRVWARVKGLDTHLEAGIYRHLTTSMTISDIIDQLLNAQPDAIRVVIPEGWRIEQIAQRFASVGLANFKEQEFLKYSKHIDQFPDAGKYPLLKSVPAGDSMEGLLFPASYQVVVNASARDVINLMLRAMSDNVQRYHLDSQAQKHHLTVYQMVILASLVEREVVFDQDRGGVASVYWNRIFAPTNGTVGFLESDPSVEYARDTENPPQHYWAELKDVGSNIATNSPWNTYVNKGLPPTPICSPGLASLQAAAAPPKTTYYYFVGKKDGHIVFASTYDQFQQDVQQYVH